MRDKLEELRFKFFDLQHAVGMRYEAIPDGIKYGVLGLALTTWLAACTLIFIETKNYVPAELPESVVVKVDVAEETLQEADTLIEGEKYAEAFNLLATHRNHFSSEYSKTDMERLETRLIDISQHAQPIEIAQLYESKDLAKQQGLYKFVGMVIEIDNDPMYGVTYTVSNSESRTQEQLEVTGLEDVSVNSQVEFYGVPTFTTVTTPIKVEAYVVPIE